MWIKCLVVYFFIRQSDIKTFATNQKWVWTYTNFSAGISPIIPPPSSHPLLSMCCLFHATHCTNHIVQLTVLIILLICLSSEITLDYMIL